MLITEYIEIAIGLLSGAFFANSVYSLLRKVAHAYYSRASDLKISNLQFNSEDLNKLILQVELAGLSDEKFEERLRKFERAAGTIEDNDPHLAYQIVVPSGEPVVTTNR
jgi:hypothetical protein